MEIKRLYCFFFLFIPVMAILLAADHFLEMWSYFFPASTDSSSHTFFSTLCFCLLYSRLPLVDVVNQIFFLYPFFPQPYMSLAPQNETVVFLFSLFSVIAFDSYLHQVYDMSLLKLLCKSLLWFS